MKKLIAFVLFPIISIFLLTSVLFYAHARIIKSEGSVNLAEDEVIDDDLFVSGETVTVKGTVNGDLYAAGGTIIIDGVINGDVLAVGGNINISGSISQDVRIAGGNITVSKANIGDSVTLAGGNVTLDDETLVGGSLLFATGILSNSADVGRGIMGGGGTVSLNGAVGKETRLATGQLTIGSSSVLQGDLIYQSDQKPTIDNEAVIFGDISEVEIERAVPQLDGFKLPERLADFTKRIVLGIKIWSYLSTLLVGILILYFFKKPSNKIVENIRKRLWRSLSLGFLALLLTGPALFLLAITGIGLPLALILGLGFIVALYLTKIFVSILFGHILFELLGREKINTYLSFALGLLIYYLLTSTLFVSFFVSLATLLLGYGAILMFEKEGLAKMRQ